MNLPALAPTLLKFCSGGNDGVLVFDKYCLEIVTVDSLNIVRDVISDDEKFIVVYRHKNTAKDQDSPLKETPNVNELDLTGCPLECPFIENESIFDCSILSNSRINGPEPGEFEPFSISESHIALRLFNDIISHIERDKFTLPAVVVICDANDVTATRAIGMQRLDNWTKRFRITSKEDSVATSKLPKLESIKRNHLWGNANATVDVTVKAQYVVFEGSEISFVAGEGTKSEVSLECEWKSAAKLLEIPNSGAKCTAHFKIILGDFHSPAYLKWNELMLLENLIKSFEKGNFAWKKMSETSVINNLNQLMDDLKSAFNKKKPEPKEKNLVLIMACSLTEDRKNLDFTDKLWSIFKDCASSDELQTCLETVFDAVMDEAIKPVIFSQNQTMLGSVINDIYRKKSLKPHLTSELALKYLIELGIEKLRQDYIHLFLGSGLATKTLLDSIISVKDNCFRESLLSLKKLHLVTEIIVLTETMLNCSRPLLCSYTRMAIKQICDKMAVDKHHSFTFPIDRQLVVEYFSRNNYPNMWILYMETKDNTYNSKTTYRLCIDERNLKKLEKNNAGFGEQYSVFISTVVTDKM